MKVTNPDGGVTTCKYDQLNRLTSYTDPEGYTFSTEYDANGNAVKSTDGRGNSKNMTYDALNRLVKGTDENNNGSTAVYDGEGRMTQYVNEEGAVTKYEYDKNGNVTKITDALGNATTFTYDAMNRVSTMTDAKGAVTKYEYTATGNVAKVTDALNGVSKYEYDVLGRVTKYTNENGEPTSYTYDALGRVTSVTNALGYTDSMTYDALGRITSVKDKNGNVTKYKYDANGNVVETIDALNHSSYFSYDGMNRLVKADLYRIDGQDKVTDEEITLYEYDKRGLVTKTVNAVGNSVIYVYDENGNLIQKTDEDGYVTKYAYSAVNLVTNINYNGGKSADYAYNKAGELVEMRDWTGVTTFKLDLLGQIVSVKDQNNKTVSYEYDEVGNQTEIKYPDKTVATYKYDLLKRMTKVTETDGKQTTYAYDAAGRLTEQIYPNGWLDQNTYDAVGQLTKVVAIDPNKQNGAVSGTANTNNTANNSNNVSGGYELKITTNNKGTVSVASGNYAAGSTITGYVTPDAGYTLKSITSSKGTVERNGLTFSYVMPAEKSVLTFVFEKGTADTTTDSSGETINYGSISEKPYEQYVADGEQKGWTNEKNPHNYMTFMTDMLSGTYLPMSDWDAQTNATSAGEIKAQYTYDPEGNVTSYYKDGAGIGEVKESYTYKYDALNRLTEAHGKFGKTDHYYTYDSLGNLTYEKTDNNKSVDYKLNSLNELTAKTVDGKDAYSYSYDKRGNSVKEIYDKFGSVEAVYTYDETNKMVKGINSSGEISEYTYNGLGALVANDWTVAENAYGYHGFTEAKPTGVPANTTNNAPNKYQKIEKDFVVDYTSKTQNPLMEYESGSKDALTYRYVYGLDRLSVNVSPVTGGAGDLDENGEIRLYYMPDRLGSARYLTSGKTGKIASWTEYDEWGAITHNTVLKSGLRELDMVQKYTNHDYDAVLGVYYAKARLYNAEDKRFMAADPVKGSVANPQTMAQYTYCLDNPLKYTDPLGQTISQWDHDNLTPEDQAKVADYVAKWEGAYARHSLADMYFAHLGVDFIRKNYKAYKNMLIPVEKSPAEYGPIYKEPSPPPEDSSLTYTVIDGMTMVMAKYTGDIFANTDGGVTGSTSAGTSNNVTAAQKSTVITSLNASSNASASEAERQQAIADEAKNTVTGYKGYGSYGEWLYWQGLGAAIEALPAIPRSASNSNGAVVYGPTDAVVYGPTDPVVAKKRSDISSAYRSWFCGAISYDEYAAVVRQNGGTPPPNTSGTGSSGTGTEPTNVSAPAVKTLNSVTANGGIKTPYDKLYELYYNDSQWDEWNTTDKTYYNKELYGDYIYVNVKEIFEKIGGSDAYNNDNGKVTAQVSYNDYLKISLTYTVNNSVSSSRGTLVAKSPAYYNSALPVMVFRNGNEYVRIDTLISFFEKAFKQPIPEKLTKFQKDKDISNLTIGNLDTYYFGSAYDAAYAFGYLYNPLTTESGGYVQEFGATISRQAEGYYTLSEIVKGPKVKYGDDADVNVSNAIKNNNNVIASIHTHPYDDDISEGDYKHGGADNMKNICVVGQTGQIKWSKSVSKNDYDNNYLTNNYVSYPIVGTDGKEFIVYFTKGVPLTPSTIWKI